MADLSAEGRADLRAFAASAGTHERDCEVDRYTPTPVACDCGLDDLRKAVPALLDALEKSEAESARLRLVAREAITLGCSSTNEWGKWVRRDGALRAAIAEHHRQKADDRCIEDDDRLYAAAGLPPCDRRVGDKAAMLANCARFIERRCEGGGWPTYAELERQIARLRAVLADAATQCRFCGHFTTIQLEMKEGQGPCPVCAPWRKALAETGRATCA